MSVHDRDSIDRLTRSVRELNDLMKRQQRVMERTADALEGILVLLAADAADDGQGAWVDVTTLDGPAQVVGGHSYMDARG